MAALQRLATAALLLCGFQTVAGCNAILGIEPAELDESVGAQECHWPSADPSRDCVSNQCESIADNCKIDECLNDRACRKKLRDYRKCAGDACDDKLGQCSDCFNDNPQATTLLKCLGKSDCGPAQAVTLCESYCRCMSQKCPLDEPGQSEAACLLACTSGNPALGEPWTQMPPPDWQIYCLWDHCERAAKDNDMFHCHHAKGLGANCQQAPEVDTNPPVCAYPKAFANGACNTGSDCCSGSCDMARGACD